jgi:hypothetical protein
MPEHTALGYTLTARILHWATAALVLTMIPIGIVMANANFGQAQDTLYHLHRSIGAVLLPIVLLRLLYRMRHPAPPLPADIPVIQQLAAHVTHCAMRCSSHINSGMDCDLGLSRAHSGNLLFDLLNLAGQSSSEKILGHRLLGSRSCFVCAHIERHCSIISSARTAC